MDSQQLQDFMSNMKGQQDIQQYNQTLASVVETMTPQEIQQVLATSKTMDVVYQKDLSKALKTSEAHYSKLAAEIQDMNPQQLQTFLDNLKSQNPELYYKKLENIMQAMSPLQAQRMFSTVSKEISDPVTQKELLEASKGSQEYYKNLAAVAQKLPANQLENLMSNLKQQGEEEYNKTLAGMFLSMTPQQVQELVNTSKSMSPEYQRDLINAIKSSEKYHKEISSAPKTVTFSQLNNSMAGLHKAVSQYVPEFELMAARAPTNDHFSKLMASVVQDMSAPQAQNFINNIKSQGPDQFSKNMSSLLKGMDVQQLHSFAETLPPQDFANILPNMSPNQLKEYMTLSTHTVGADRMNKSFANAVPYMNAEDIQGFMSNLRAQGDAQYNKGLVDILQKMTPEQVQATVNHSEGMDLIYQNDLVNAASSLNAPGLYYKNLAGSLLNLSAPQLQSYMTALKYKSPEVYKKNLAGMLLSMTPAQLKQLINTSKAMDPVYFHDMVDVLRNSEKYYKEIIPPTFNRVPSTFSNTVNRVPSTLMARESEVGTQFPEPKPEHGLKCSECSKNVVDLPSETDDLMLRTVDSHTNNVEIQTEDNDDAPLVEDIEDNNNIRVSQAILIKGEGKTLRQTLRTQNLPSETKYYKKSSRGDSLNVSQSQIKRGELISDNEEMANDHPIGETINPLVKSERRMSRRPSNPSKFLASKEVKAEEPNAQATPKKLQQSLENLVENEPQYARRLSRTQIMKPKTLIEEAQAMPEKSEATTPKRSILKKNTVYSPKNVEIIPLSGMISDNETKKMPGKDETWHIPEASEVINQSTFSVKKPNLPAMGDASNNGIQTDFDATLNENLNEDGKFKKRIVKRSSKRHPSGNTRTIDIQTETKKRVEESKTETPLEGRPSSSRTLSHQGSAWLAKEDEGQAFKSGKLGETLDEIDKERDLMVAPPLNNSVISKKNMTRSRLDMYRMSAEDAVQDSVTNFREEMDRSRSVRLPGTGVKLARMTSTDSKADFEVKLGKQNSVASGKVCGHHEI